MYIINGIAYAGDPDLIIKVSGVRPLNDHLLWVRFNTGEAKIFNFSHLIHEPAFSALVDENVFRTVYIDHGVVVWDDGNIDISPEVLYREGVAAHDTATA